MHARYTRHSNSTISLIGVVLARFHTQRVAHTHSRSESAFSARVCVCTHASTHKRTYARVLAINVIPLSLSPSPRASLASSVARFSSGFGSNSHYLSKHICGLPLSVSKAPLWSRIPTKTQMIVAAMEIPVSYLLYILLNVLGKSAYICLIYYYYNFIPLSFIMGWWVCVLCVRAPTP